MVKTSTNIQYIPTCCLCFLNEIFTPLSLASSALYRLHFKVQKVSKVSFPKGIKSQFRYCPALSDRDELWKQRPQEGPFPTVGMLAKPTLHQAWVEGPSSLLLCRWCFLLLKQVFQGVLVHHQHSVLQVRSFECVFIFVYKKLTVDSLFSALVFHQFLQIFEQPFWKLHFWGLALLVTWYARPCAPGRLSWFFSLFKHLIMSGRRMRQQVCSVRASALKSRQFNFFSKLRTRQSNLHRNWAGFVLNFIRKMNK